MATPTATKCAHPACKCTVEVEEPFCSEWCAGLEDEPHLKCSCGHLECAGADEAVESEEEELDTPAA